MKFSDYVIFCSIAICFITVVILTVIGGIDKTMITERYNVVKYDLDQEYFIYVDSDGYINKISWDLSVWDRESPTVEMKQSDKLYIEKISVRFSRTHYILYLNASEIAVIVE